MLAKGQLREHGGQLLRGLTRQALFQAAVQGPACIYRLAVRPHPSWVGRLKDCKQ